MTSSAERLTPYIAGVALSEDRGFFGRDDVFREVQRMLKSPDGKAIVLYGQRRIGKTSVLLQLEKRLRQEGYSPVFFDLMDKTRLSLQQVLYELACEIAGVLNLKKPLEKDFDGEGRFLREVFLPEMQASHPSTTLVLMFDEFDVLDVLAEDQLGPTTAAKAFFPYLRRWMTEATRIRFVIVVGRKPNDLSTDFLATFKEARSKHVSVLARQDTIDLIYTAEREGSLQFAPEAIEAILDQTSGHPFLTQLLCQVIWNQAWDDEPKEIPCISAADVINAVPAAIELGSSQLQWIWDGLPPAEKVVMAAIAEAGQRVVSPDDLVAMLQQSGIKIIVRELEIAPETLVRWELLRPVTGGYTFFVELIRAWVSEYYHLALVKDQIDRVDPLADTLYRTAELFYRREGDLENASGQLSRALAINPNHLKARLLMGQILQEQGQIESAIQEFEKAYDYDSNGARFSLVKALLARGEKLEQAGDENSALSTYGRIIEVSPRDQVAAERVSAIQIRREAEKVEEHETAQRWEEALRGYRRLAKKQPGNAKWSEAILRVTDALIESEADQALKYEKGHSWDQALDIYRQLAKRRPGETRWAEAIDRVAAAKIQQDADQAHEFEVQGRWDEALAIYRLLATRQSSNALWPEAIQRVSSARIQAEVDQALAHEKAGRWTEALSIYNKLAEQQPDVAQWQDNIALVEVEAALAQRFDEGLIALKEKRWKDAQQAFAEVIGRRPDYTRERMAAELLTEAIQGASQATSDGGTEAPSRRFVIIEAKEQVLGSLPPDLAVISPDNMTQIRSLGIFKEGIQAENIGFSPDGQRLLSDCWSGTTVWDVNSGQKVIELKEPLKEIAFSPDGQRLAEASLRDVLIWDVHSGRKLAEYGKSSDGGLVVSLTFSPDRSRLATGDADGNAKIWDCATGKELIRLKGHKNWITAVRFSPDSTHLATASRDRTVRLWDLATGGMIARYEVGKTLTEQFSSILASAIGARNEVESVAFHLDGKILAALDSNNQMWIWSVESNECLHRFKAASSAHLVFSPDGNYLTNGHKIWNTRSGVLAGRTYIANVRDPFAVSADWKILVSRKYRQIYVVELDLDDSKEGRIHKLNVDPGSVRSVALNPTGTLIASVGWDASKNYTDTIHFWGVSGK